MSQVPALRRAVAILRHLAASNRPISAGTLARSENVPRSSAYELLNVLEELGLVTKVDAGYLLGPGVAELGSAYLRINPLQRVAQKDVRALAERARGVAQLAVIRGWETVYVLKEQSVHSMAVITAAVHMPAYLTATGRAIMATMEKRDVLAALSREVSFVNRTGKGPRSVHDLMGELTRVRAQGYAIETGEITPGVWTVAVPVYDAAERAVERVNEAATLCTRAASNVTQLIGGGLKA